MSTVQELTKRKHKVAIMNAVHDLPVLVARDLGVFKDEGLDIEFVTTPGMARIASNSELTNAMRLSISPYRNSGVSKVSSFSVRMPRSVLRRCWKVCRSRPPPVSSTTASARTTPRRSSTRSVRPRIRHAAAHRASRAPRPLPGAAW